MMNVMSCCSLLKLLTPRNNTRDTLACEVFLAALTQTNSPISLELAATTHERQFLLRGESAALTHAAAQIRHAYPQCEAQAMPPEADPLHTQGLCMGMTLRLRDAPYLPIRTAVSRESHADHTDFAQSADPMIGLLSAMDGLGDGERCLIQYTLTPLPDNWSTPLRGSLRDIESRAQSEPQHTVPTLLQAIALAAFVSGGLLALASIALKWGPIAWLISAILLLSAIVLLWLRLHLPGPPDPLLLKHKLGQPAFRVCIRVLAFAPTEAAAQQRLNRIAAAFRAYNLPGGNGFVCGKPFTSNAERQRNLSVSLRPPRLCGENLPRWPLRLELMGFAPPSLRSTCILNISEVAALWHLPHAEAGLQGIAYTSSRQLLAPASVLAEDGILIGHSHAMGQRVEARLARASLRGNIGLVAKTQSGKSNLMAILASDVIANDPDATVIVIDPHRSLAQQVAALVPAARQGQMTYWSLAEREHPISLNLLDRARPANADARALRPIDKQADDIIGTLREIWSENWGPRMTDYLRGALLTLLNANEIMIEGYAFEQWHALASSTLGAVRDAFTRGPIDAQVWQMLDELIVAFRTIAPPTRPSREKLHKRFGRLFDQLDAARANSALSSTQREEAAQAIYIALCVTHPPPRKLDATPATGLAARWYVDAHGQIRPQQFTLLDVNAVLTDKTIRDMALGALPVDHPARAKLLAWWAEAVDYYERVNPRLLVEMITPVTKKINHFILSDVASGIFGQPDSGIDLPKVINNGEILLIDLAAGMVGSDTAALVGATVLNWVAAQVFGRQDDRPPTTDHRGNGGSGRSSDVGGQRPKARRIFIVIDEFQSIPGADYAQLLSELAKYGAQLCMGTQSLEALAVSEAGQRTRAAWLANINALFVFRCGAEDAEVMARELGVGDVDRLTVTAGDMVGLADYACFARLRDGSGVPRIFGVKTRKAT